VGQHLQLTCGAAGAAPPTGWAPAGASHAQPAAVLTSCLHASVRWSSNHEHTRSVRLQNKGTIFTGLLLLRFLTPSVAQDWQLLLCVRVTVSARCPPITAAPTCFVNPEDSDACQHLIWLLSNLFVVKAQEKNPVLRPRWNISSE